MLLYLTGIVLYFIIQVLSQLSGLEVACGHITKTSTEDAVSTEGISMRIHCTATELHYSSSSIDRWHDCGHWRH